MAAKEPTDVDTIIVTAQKQNRNISTVGMFVHAASGEESSKLGMPDPTQLGKLVQGLTFTPKYHSTPI